VYTATDQFISVTVTEPRSRCHQKSHASLFVTTKLAVLIL